jgi:radical SAM superfamily enzyme YgiQ (UPF0313 family)
VAGVKFYFHVNKVNFKEYSIRLIKKLLARWMVDDPGQADYILVSICDITEIADIIKAGQYKKPVIAGGMISEYPLINEIADYVWHGEIYGFRDALAGGVAIEDMVSITSKTNRELVIDQKISWDENPIIKVGKRACYYYVAKGCPVKCKYCYIGNVRDYQTIPRARYNQALKIAGKNLMPIAAFNPYGIPDNANIGETLLKKYVNGNHGIKAKMIRSGVEFVTPVLSENLAKGVTIDHFNEALRRSKRENTKMILYFIVGLETQGDLEMFFSQIDIDYATTPAVSIVLTYLDAQPFTPFSDFDLRGKITGIDVNRLYRIMSERNKRFRTIPLARPEKSMIRTLLSRCQSLDDYKLVKSFSKLKYNDMIDRIAEHDHLIGSVGIKEILGRPRRAVLPSYWITSDFQTVAN